MPSNIKNLRTAFSAYTAFAGAKVQRIFDIREVLIVSCYVSLCQKIDGLKAVVIAGYIGNGSVTCEHELVNIKRLTCQEERRDECVSCA